MELRKRTIIIFVLLILFLIKYTFTDILIFFSYIGSKILPSKPMTGFLLVMTILFVAIFFKEINNFFSRIKVKGG